MRLSFLLRPLRRRLPGVFRVVFLACAAACGDAEVWTLLEVQPHLRDVQLRLPDEPIFEIASAPDGAMFVSTFRGNVYQRRAGGGGWHRVMHVPPHVTQPVLLALHAFSERSFIAIEGPRIYRWREGQPPRLDYRPTAADSTDCGDFVAQRKVTAVWGTEDDTYAVGGQLAVLHYRGGAWRLEPVSAQPPDLCGQPPATGMVAVAGGADGWVYAGGQQIIRSRGDGVWEAVRAPRQGDTTVSTGAMARDGGGLLLTGWPRVRDSVAAREQRFYRPGRGAGEWREVARVPSGITGLDEATAHPAGPAVFFSLEGLVAIVRGNRVRGYFASPNRIPLRGAVPVGDDVMVALNDGPDGYVVRLPR